MTMQFDELVAIYPEQLWLEFSLEDRERAWARSQEQPYSNASARWRAFINHLCLDIVGKWLQDYLDATSTLQAWPHLSELPQVWELVNGTAVSIDKTKFILIPSDESNLKEFQVPREWVDIPSWAGHYYLAVQLNLEENWLRVWGYTTHQTLRQGQYDLRDRTYAIDREELVEDLTAMFVTKDLYPAQRPTVESQPPLSEAQAEILLEKLGQPTPYSPRLESPFSQWATLLENAEWRRDLCRRRWNQKPEKSVVPLSQWFQIEQSRKTLQSMGWQISQRFFIPEFAFNFRFGKKGPRESRIGWFKQLDRELQTNSSITLVMNLSYDDCGSLWIGPQLKSVNPIAKLPAGIKLIVLDNDGSIFTTIQADQADNLIQIQQFTAEVGESFSILVENGASQFIQEFTV